MQDPGGRQEDLRLPSVHLQELADRGEDFLHAGQPGGEVRVGINDVQQSRQDPPEVVDVGLTPVAGPRKTE